MGSRLAVPERLNASTLLDRSLEAGRGESVALITSDETVTYVELARLTAGMCSYLGEIGVQREQRVLMILDDSPAFYATFLAAMRIGAVPVPVTPMDRVDNYRYYLEDSYARVLVAESALLPALEEVLAGRGDVQVVAVGGEATSYPRFQAMLSGRHGELPPPADTHRDAMAFWLYSS